MAQILAGANSRKGLEERTWEIYAYAARYGRQPISELKAMTLRELTRFIGEINRMVEAEQAPRED